MLPRTYPHTILLKSENENMRWQPLVKYIVVTLNKRLEWQPHI